ncbi:hypothetical protein lacNasYZ03_14400 [Lactobacillus nasalidis]|uniref:HTH lysR-type domain-containing protein n=1 Tax=Lactobacillus nasalidis TaxID=2797258 RepID=A0ABQ3W6R6_9LACO|nr:LysR family transcriptional regulator [Lactobacillus nasalidis]GHV97818.1 hypothetical protein lacNasYZ01_10000 [Lactobacillus nasalidis]GHV98715.1 hypothetical protein lacNasYZ02_01450 [Lactobacillus nasalidis]GHW01753.1 hypothetical protein lacNasYZ03_14400 [Lactobacillus nasalidis]
MNDQLKTFIAVADNQSFNKAANELYLSAPAVIKQVNHLEDSIKVKLFDRNHNGVTLTEAGRSFYKDAVRLLSAYDQSIDRARNATGKKMSIKIGAGPLATGTATTNLWVEVGKRLPQLRFQFIPCSCSLGNFNEFLAGIGKDFDLVSSVYDENLLNEYDIQALQLDITPLRLSVPVNNPLAKKDELTLRDLDKQKIALPAKGKFRCFDQARDFLKQNSKIDLQEIPGFDMNVLNQCVSNDWLLCSAEDWQTAHPFLKAKKVAWNCTVPFGIVYSKKPSATVIEVIDLLKEGR